MQSYAETRDRKCQYNSPDRQRVWRNDFPGILFSCLQRQRFVDKRERREFCVPEMRERVSDASLCNCYPKVLPFTPATTACPTGLQTPEEILTRICCFEREMQRRKKSISSQSACQQNLSSIQIIHLIPHPFCSIFDLISRI